MTESQPFGSVLPDDQKALLDRALVDSLAEVHYQQGHFDTAASLYKSELEADQGRLCKNHGQA